MDVNETLHYKWDHCGICAIKATIFWMMLGLCMEDHSFSINRVSLRITLVTVIETHFNINWKLKYHKQTQILSRK